MARQSISKAEEFFGLHRDKIQAVVALNEALSIEETAGKIRARRLQHDSPGVFSGEDHENHRVFTAVLTRSFALAFAMGEVELAERTFNRAHMLAIDSMYGEVEQGEEILALWRRLTMPWWKRPFIVLRDFFTAVGEYEIRKQ